MSLRLVHPLMQLSFFAENRDSTDTVSRAILIVRIKVGNHLKQQLGIVTKEAETLVPFALLLFVNIRYLNLWGLLLNARDIPRVNLIAKSIVYFGLTFKFRIGTWLPRPNVTRKYAVLLLYKRNDFLVVNLFGAVLQLLEC